MGTAEDLDTFGLGVETGSRSGEVILERLVLVNGNFD
jgi:hypothetical protein